MKKVGRREVSMTCVKAVPEFAVRSKHDLIGLHLTPKKLIDV